MPTLRYRAPAIKRRPILAPAAIPLTIDEQVAAELSRWQARKQGGYLTRYGSVMNGPIKAKE